MSAEQRPVIPLEYAPTHAARRDRRWWMAARVSLIASLLCLLIGWLLMFVDVETGVVTGPTLCTTGLVLTLVAWRTRVMPAVLIGIGHCSICVLFLMLVNVRRWSPGEATIPFRVMAGLYTFFVAGPATAVVLLLMRGSAPARFHTATPIASAATLASDDAKH